MAVVVAVVVAVGGILVLPTATQQVAKGVQEGWEVVVTLVLPTPLKNEMVVQEGWI